MSKSITQLVLQQRCLHSHGLRKLAAGREQRRR
jgi:hypothetical protein